MLVLPLRHKTITAMITIRPKSLVDCYRMIDTALAAEEKKIVMATKESDIETAFHFSSLGLWIRNELIRKYDLKAGELYGLNTDPVTSNMLDDPDNMCCVIIKGYREHLINKQALANQ